MTIDLVKVMIRLYASGVAQENTDDDANSMYDKVSHERNAIMDIDTGNDVSATKWILSEMTLWMSSTVLLDSVTMMCQTTHRASLHMKLDRQKHRCHTCWWYWWSITKTHVSDARSDATLLDVIRAWSRGLLIKTSVPPWPCETYMGHDK